MRSGESFSQGFALYFSLEKRRDSGLRFSLNLIHWDSERGRKATTLRSYSPGRGVALRGLVGLRKTRESLLTGVGMRRRNRDVVRPDCREDPGTNNRSLGNEGRHPGDTGLRSHYPEQYYVVF